MKKLLAILITACLGSSLFAQTAVMLRNNGYLRSDKGNGKVGGAEQISAGTTFTLTAPSSVKKDLELSSGTEKGIDFYQVDYNGAKYFLRASESVLLENSMKLGALTSDATLFDEARPSSFRNAYLEAGDLVVTGSNKNFSGILDFTEIWFWDSNERVVKTRFVQKKNVTSNENDVKAIRFLERVNSSTDQKIKENYAQKALETAETEEIYAIAQKTYNTVMGVFEEVYIGEIYVASYDPAGENINLRDAPGKNGAKIGQVASGRTGVATKRSDTKDTINGKSAYWLYVNFYDESGYGWAESGWIFGEYISELGE